MDDEYELYDDELLKEIELGLLEGDGLLKEGCQSDIFQHFQNKNDTMLHLDLVNEMSVEQTEQNTIDKEGSCHSCVNNPNNDLQDFPDRGHLTVEDPVSTVSSEEEKPQIMTEQKDQQANFNEKNPEVNYELPMKEIHVTELQQIELTPEHLQRNMVEEISPQHDQQRLQEESGPPQEQSLPKSLPVQKLSNPLLPLQKFLSPVHQQQQKQPPLTPPTEQQQWRRDKETLVMRYAQSEQKNIELQSKMTKLDQRFSEWSRDREIILGRMNVMKSDRLAINGQLENRVKSKFVFDSTV